MVPNRASSFPRVQRCVAKRGFRVIVAATGLVAVIIGVLCGFVLWPHEPSYEGHTLSWWLEQRRTATKISTFPPQDDPGTVAVRQIGTNALPTLLRLIRTRDSPFKQFVMKWSAKQSLIKFHFVPLEERRFQATSGYEVLGTLARSHIPALSEILTNHPVPGARAQAASALGFIGRDDANLAAPALIKATKDKQDWVRNNSLWASSRILPDPQLTIPVLIAGLDDSYSIARENAAIGLRQYGAQATSAVPALVRTLEINRVAGYALSGIDPQAAAKAGVK
jgi:hypothetical protein